MPAKPPPERQAPDDRSFDPRGPSNPFAGGGCLVFIAFAVGFTLLLAFMTRAAGY